MKKDTLGGFSPLDFKTYYNKTLRLCGIGKGQTNR